MHLTDDIKIKNTTNTIPAEQVAQEKPTLEANVLPMDVFKWALNTVNLVDIENRAEEERRIRKYVRNRRFYNGQQVGFIDPYTGAYIDFAEVNPTLYQAAQNEEEPLYVKNYYRATVKQLRKEWSRSSARFHVVPVTERFETRGAAHIASKVIEYYQSLLFTPDFRLREAENALNCGNYFRYVYWDKKAKKKDERSRYYRPRIVNDQEVQHTGDVVLQQVDAMEVKVPLNARNLDTAAWLRWRRRVYREMLQKEYPNCLIPLTGQTTTTSAHQKDLEGSPGNNGQQELLINNSDGTVGQIVEFDQIWVRPYLYNNMVIEKTIQLENGKVFEQGRRFDDYFPDGIYIACVGGKILDLDNENFSYCWSHGTFDLIGGRFYGDGLDDLIEIQRQLNEVTSLMFEHWMTNATPNILYNVNHLDASQFSGRPGEITPVLNLMEGQRMDDVVKRLDGTNLPQDVLNAPNMYLGDMQALSGAFSTLSSAPDMMTETATGAAIVRDQSLSLLAPVFEQKGEVDKRTLQQILMLAQQYCDESFFLPLIGEYDKECIKYFKSADIETEFTITAEQGSWNPITETEQNKNFFNYVNMIVANPTLSPELKQKGAEIFRIDLDLRKEHVDAKRCRQRIESFRKWYMDTIHKTPAEQIINSQPESEEHAMAQEMVYQQIEQKAMELCPVKVLIDDHMVCMDTYKEWLKTDIGMSAPLMVQKIFESRVMDHFKSAMQLQQILAPLMGGGPEPGPGKTPQYSTESDVIKAGAELSAPNNQQSSIGVPGQVSNKAQAKPVNMA